MYPDTQKDEEIVNEETGVEGKRERRCWRSEE
jgi:hypothetical protein